MQCIKRSPDKAAEILDDVLVSVLAGDPAMRIMDRSALAEGFHNLVGMVDRGLFRDALDKVHPPSCCSFFHPTCFYSSLTLSLSCARPSCTTRRSGCALKTRMPWRSCDVVSSRSKQGGKEFHQRYLWLCHAARHSSLGSACFFLKRKEDNSEIKVTHKSCLEERQ